MGRKGGSTAPYIKAGMIVLIVIGVLYIGTMTNLLNFGTPQQIVNIGGTPQPAVTGDLRTCDSGATITLSMANRNPLAPSAIYNASAIRVVKNGAIIGTGTTTAGTSLSFASITVPCTLENFNGEVYGVSSSSMNSAKDTYTITGSSTSKILTIPTGSQLNFTWLDYSTGVDASPRNSTVTTHNTSLALSAGQSVNTRLKVSAPSLLYSQYGSTDGGIFICIDTVDGAAFTDKAVSLSSGDVALTEVDCSTDPKATGVNSCNRCYKMRALTNNDADVFVSVKVSNDGGTDAGATSDPVIYFDDVQYFEDTDGTVKQGTHNSGGTNQGISACSATINIS